MGLLGCLECMQPEENTCRHFWTFLQKQSFSVVTKPSFLQSVVLLTATRNHNDFTNRCRNSTNQIYKYITLITANITAILPAPAETLCIIKTTSGGYVRYVPEGCPGSGLLTSRLLLTGLPVHQRLVFILPKFFLTTPLLRSFHWLPVAVWIKCETLVLVYHAVMDQALPTSRAW